MQQAGNTSGSPENGEAVEIYGQDGAMLTDDHDSYELDEVPGEGEEHAEFGPPPRVFSARTKWIATGAGVLFALGIGAWACLPSSETGTDQTESTPDATNDVDWQAAAELFLADTTEEETADLHDALVDYVTQNALFDFSQINVTPVERTLNSRAEVVEGEGPSAVADIKTPEGDLISFRLRWTTDEETGDVAGVEVVIPQITGLDGQVIAQEYTATTPAEVGGAVSALGFILEASQAAQAEQAAEVDQDQTDETDATPPGFVDPLSDN